jgi:predicted Zn-dependent protease
MPSPPHFEYCHDQDYYSHNSQTVHLPKGSFQSPFQQSVNELSAGKLNEIMLKAYNQLKVNDQIVSAHAMAMIIETESNFVSSNGSDVQQNFLMVQSDYSAMAHRDDIYQRRKHNQTQSLCV